MKILVIEDEKRIADNIKKGLEFKAYTVDVQYDGQNGFEIASTEHYDLIILDINLPGKDGLTICRQLRDEGNSVPIIMLTARTQIEDKVIGLEIGADDYLTKPFAFEELLARIKALTRRPKTNIIKIFNLGDLRLDQQTKQVSRGNKQIHLSKKEYALLEFLIRHPNQIFTKEQLAEKVWNFDANIEVNTAQVYIGYLRNKIDRPFPKQPALIKTIRGFGYKIGF